MYIAVKWIETIIIENRIKKGNIELIITIYYMKADNLYLFFCEFLIFGVVTGIIYL